MPLIATAPVRSPLPPLAELNEEDATIAALGYELLLKVVLDGWIMPRFQRRDARDQRRSCDG